MTEKIDSFTENKARHNWLKGLSRYDNAADCGISTGAISNIIKNYIDDLIGYDIAAIRDFVVQKRKENLSLEDCARGYRLTSILNALGISDDDNQLSIFLADAHKISNQSNITPIVMRDCLLELTRMAKEILPSQLKTYLQLQREQKQILKEEIRNLKEEINKIEKTKMDIEKKFIQFKQQIDITSADLDWYSSIKEDLEKDGISVEDISFLTRTIKTIKNHSSKKVFDTLQKINEIGNLDKEIHSKKITCDALKADINTVKEIDSQYLETLNSKILLLDSLKHIQDLGFSLKDLKKIEDTLYELSLENEMSFKEIKGRFFELLSKYGKNITLEKEKETLEYLISDLDKEITKNRSVIISENSIGIILKNLIDKGINENGIIRVKKFVDKMERNNIDINSLTENPIPATPQIIIPNIMEYDNKFNLALPYILINQSNNIDLDSDPENKIV